MVRDENHRLQNPSSTPLASTAYQEHQILKFSSRRRAVLYGTQIRLADLAVNNFTSLDDMDLEEEMSMHYRGLSHEDKRFLPCCQGRGGSHSAKG